MSSRNSNALRSTGDEAHASGAGRYGTRLQLGGYLADIVPDHDENEPIYHCIVQRIGSLQVLYLGQEKTFADALETGHRHLEELAGAHREKHRAIYEFTTTRALK